MNEDKSIFVTIYTVHKTKFGIFFSKIVSNSAIFTIKIGYKKSEPNAVPIGNKHFNKKQK